MINTFCVNTLSGINIPKSTDELTRCILRMIPQFLNVVYNKEHLYCVDNSESAGYVLETLDAENLYCPAEPEYMPLILVAGKPKGLNVRELCSLGSNCVKYIFPLFTVIVEYKCGPYIKMGEDKEFVMRIMDSGPGIHRQYFANIRLYSDDGLIVRGVIFTVSRFRICTATKLKRPLQFMWKE